MCSQVISAAVAATGAIVVQLQFFCEPGKQEEPVLHTGTADQSDKYSGGSDWETAWLQSHAGLKFDSVLTLVRSGL